MTAVQSGDDLFVLHRGELFGLAYRMLGSIADAEDVVSETYLRWRRASQTTNEVARPRAYLFSIAARLSIDTLRSVRRTRVDYVGTWLPEPLLTSWDDDVAERMGRRDTLSFGLMVLLEQLTPVERAVFILREAFDYPHDEIAQMLEMSAVNVRQHFRRATRRLAQAGPPRFSASRAKQNELMQRFLAAASSGEVQPLAELLAADAMLYADGGGKATVVPRPMQGGVRIARFFRGLARQAPADMRIDVVCANGDPAMLVRTSDEVIGVYAFEVDDDAGCIRAVHVVRNPDKLQHVDAVRP